MEHIKKILRHHILSLIVSGLALFFLVYVAMINDDGLMTALSYGFMIFAACMAALSLFRTSRLAERLRARFAMTPERQRFLDDPVFRSEMMIYQGLFLNNLYAVIKLFAGLVLGSVWYFVLAVYYLCLCSLRYFLLRYVRRGEEQKSPEAAWRHYRLFGWLLLILNQVLTVLVLYMVYKGSGFVYSGPLIFAMAGYAFYAVIMSLVGLIRFRKYRNPIVSAAKIINLSAALVTMLALETAMFNEFGEREGEFARNVLMASGGVVCVLVLIMAIYMIIRGTLQINKYVSGS